MLLFPSPVAFIHFYFAALKSPGRFKAFNIAGLNLFKRRIPATSSVSSVTAPFICRLRFGGVCGLRVRLTQQNNISAKKTAGVFRIFIVRV